MLPERQIINTGQADNDGTGDTLRVAGQKSNNNFQALFDGYNSNENAVATANASAQQALDSKQSAAAAAERAQVAKLGTGEMAHDIVIGVGANNGATMLSRSSRDETLVGFTIPAGQTGVTSSIAGYFLIPVEMISRFTGATINLVGVYQHEAGFPGAKTINNALTNIIILRNGNTANGGEVVSSAAVSATLYMRETKFVLAADQARVGQQFFVSASTDNSTDWTARMVSFAVRCSAVPANAAFTPADVNAWLDHYQTDRPWIGQFLSLATGTQSAANGAVARAVNGKIVGATIPSGQTGAGTNNLLDLGVSPSWAGLLAGQVPWVAVLVRHNAGFSRPLVLRLQRQAGQDLSLNNSRVISLSPTESIYIARGHWNSPLSGTETLLRAYMRIAAIATATSGDEWFEVADVHWGVAISNNLTPAQAADRVRETRTRDAITTGDVGLQEQLNAANVNIAALIKAQTIGFASVGQQLATGAYAANNFTFSRWAVGADQGTDFNTNGVAIAAIRFPRVTIGAEVVTIRLRAWRRPLNAAVIDAAPGASFDTLHQFSGASYVDYSAAGLGITPGGANVDLRFILPSPIPAANVDGTVLIMDIQGIDGSGNPGRLGVGTTGGQTSDLAQRKRGYFGNPGFNTVADTALRVSYGIDTSAIFDAGANEIRLAAIEASIVRLDPSYNTDFLLPDRIYLTAGRPVPFNIGMQASKRIEPGNIDVSLESLRLLPTAPTGTPPKPALMQRGTGSLQLDPDAVTGSVLVTARRRGVDNQRMQKSIPVTVAAWSKTGTKRILILGDSLAAQHKTSAIYQELLACGITPVMIGDLPGGFNGATIITGHEGRGGKAMADFTYRRVYSAADVNTMKPCNDITYAEYTALPRTGANAAADAKERRNPFLVASTGGDSYNGFRFSLAQYLSYTGKAAPDYVFVSLGTNDGFQLPSTAMAGITAGIGIIVRAVREVSPNIQIVFYSDGLGWRGDINGPGGYYEVHHTMLRTQYAAVKELIAAGDTRLAYIPIGLHQDENRFGLMTIQSTDTYGLRTVVDDAVQAGYLHPSDSNILVGASVLASYVRATS